MSGRGRRGARRLPPFLTGLLSSGRVETKEFVREEDRQTSEGE